MLRVVFGLLLATYTSSARAIDFQTGYSLENNEAVAASLTKCYSLDSNLTKSQRDKRELICNLRSKELTLLEYFSMQDGCSTFESDSTASRECALTVTKLHRHFAADLPPVALPPLNVYEQALLIEGCTGLSGDKNELCRSGAKKLEIK